MSDKIHHEVAGRGTKVILLHGFCESSEVWWRLKPLLSQHYELIMPDLPGFGKSPLPEKEISIENVAEQVCSWIHEISNNEKVFVLGHSLGGYVALNMANMCPELLQGIGLMNSSTFADDEEKKKGRLKTIDFINKNGKDRFLETFVPGLFAEINRTHLKDSIQKVQEIALNTSEATMTSYTLAMRNRASMVNILEQRHLPILFLGGKADALIPEETSVAQMKILKDHAYLLERCGHMCMIESPEETAEIIKDFINAVS